MSSKVSKILASPSLFGRVTRGLGKEEEEICQDFVFESPPTGK